MFLLLLVSHVASGLVGKLLLWTISSLVSIAHFLSLFACSSQVQLTGGREYYGEKEQASFFDSQHLQLNKGNHYNHCLSPPGEGWASSQTLGFSPSLKKIILPSHFQSISLLGLLWADNLNTIVSLVTILLRACLPAFERTCSYKIHSFSQKLFFFPTGTSILSKINSLKTGTAFLK